MRVRESLRDSLSLVASCALIVLAYWLAFR